MASKDIFREKEAALVLVQPFISYFMAFICTRMLWRRIPVENLVYQTLASSSPDTLLSEF